MAVYRHDQLRKIEFPLGGIGTGNISLSGRGELINWEFFSTPNKESTNLFSHFAIKAERDGKVLDARVLHGDIQEDFYGSGLGGHHSWGYGHGPQRTTLCGLPHFRDVRFRSAFPFAQVDFEDSFPGNVTLEAFNPFIPSNDRDSSIPAAFFTLTVRNTTPAPITYRAAFSCGNPFETGTVNRQFTEQNLTGVCMTGAFDERTPRLNGSVCISTDADDANLQEYWYRGDWFDELTVFWQEFSAPGPLPPRHYADPGTNDMTTLEASVTVHPYETRSIRFLLSWYVPRFVKTWDSRDEKPSWNNYVVKLFPDHRAMLGYIHSQWPRLEEESRRFSQAILGSDLPAPMLDAVVSNLAILKSPTCHRLENGEFYAFEGTNRNKGSCEGSCAHVWNYAYALPFLFPKLERSMRELDYTYNQRENGGMEFRLMLPLGSEPWGFRPCVDGEMGGILKFYREWKLSGDDEWLRKWWPKVRKSLEYAWSPDNPDQWDPEQTGVISGRQHHTLDMELFGPNSWLTGMYLAALKAASEMAVSLGDQEASDTYLSIFRRGQKFMEEQLFNGSYYIQKLDLANRSLVESLCHGKADAYWDEEIGQVKYQYTEGCEIDQMLGQWHAGLLGLGDILDPDHCRQAAANLYANNFKSMRDNCNPCRIFSVNDEEGTVICTWPRGSQKPRIPIPYTEECMAGFEYAAAGMVLQAGMEPEAIRMVAAVRNRYDGSRRNPFGEIECGSSYARSMASYSFLLLYSGFRFDLSRGEIGFAPLHLHNGYQTFWAVDGAWGQLHYLNGTWILEVLYGSITLSSLSVPDDALHSAILGSIVFPLTRKGQSLCFCEPVQLQAGKNLILIP